MRIVGFVETSLVDWDGQITSVVFTGGCNFVCPFCHNAQVADDDPALPEVAWPDIAAVLERKRKWVDGVVLTGGEPAMHPELFGLCERIKRLGFKVKLDTNGSFPYVVRSLIERRLVDFVAMDIKAPLNHKYVAATGHDVEPALIRRSIRLLVESGMDHEFRCTLVPGLIDPADIPEIGAAIRGARCVVLQHFNPEGSRAESYRKKGSYTRAEAEAMAEALRPFVCEAKLRGKFV